MFKTIASFQPCVTLLLCCLAQCSTRSGSDQIELQVVSRHTGEPVGVFQVGVKAGIPNGVATWETEESLNGPEHVAVFPGPPNLVQVVKEADGRFRVDSLLRRLAAEEPMANNEGSITLFVRADGFALGKFTFRKDNIPSSPVVLRLEDQAAIFGRVTDAGGVPVEGVAVMIGPVSHTDALMTRGLMHLIFTNTSGGFCLSGFPSEQPLVTFRHAEYAPTFRELRPADFGRGLGDIVLHNPASVRGRVSGGGSAVGKAIVAFCAKIPSGCIWFSRYTRSTEQGVFDMPELPVGPVMILCSWSSDNYDARCPFKTESIEKRIDLESGKEHTVSFLFE